MVMGIQSTVVRRVYHEGTQETSDARAIIQKTALRSSNVSVEVGREPVETYEVLP